MHTTPHGNDRRQVRHAIGFCPPLQAWPVEVLDQLASAARIRRYASDERIPLRDQCYREICFVVSGAVAVDWTDVSGTHFLLSVHGANETLGWLHLLEDVQFVYDFHARGPTMLANVPVHAMRQILNAHPLLWKNVSLMALQRLHQQILLQRWPTFHQLDRRLIDVVLRLAQGAERSTSAGRTQLTVRVSQSDLAAMLSVSRQTVNKQLRLLAENGLLRTQYGCLILNLGTLNEFARFRFARSQGMHLP